MKNLLLFAFYTINYVSGIMRYNKICVGSNFSFEMSEISDGCA